MLLISFFTLIYYGSNSLISIIEHCLIEQTSYCIYIIDILLSRHTWSSKKLFFSFISISHLQNKLSFFYYDRHGHITQDCLTCIIFISKAFHLFFVSSKIYFLELFCYNIPLQGVKNYVFFCSQSEVGVASDLV